MKKNFKIILILVINCFYFFPQILFAEDRLKIGLLVPMSGDNKELGQLIIKAVRIAINDIDSNKIEILPKDTASDPNKTLKSAKELAEAGVKIVIGPIFYKNLAYLDEVNDVIFLSLTNKTLDLPENVISSGINSTSQLNTIKKFIKQNKIKKTIFLTPKTNYENEIKAGIKKSKLSLSKYYTYKASPTELTEQIEKITNYKTRKQNLLDEINRLEKSDDINNQKKIKILEKKYTLGNVNFDSVIIADFSEGLKSVTTSLIYSDVSPDKKYFITLNQWFDESLIQENDIQPIYFPSINKGNLEKFRKKFYLIYNEYPNHLSLLSFDLVGLIYYLSIKDDFSDIDKLFKKKNSFKGKIGIFDIKDNKINHRLNFYKIENKNFKKIF
jgi:hypothetical protein